MTLTRWIYKLILGLCISMVPFDMYAQELNATVTINTRQLEAGLHQRFETLQDDLREFINGRQWTSAQFSQVEKIRCSFALTISEQTDNDKYNASLTVQSSRPVYNSSYSTNMLNWQDDNISFLYTEGQTLTFNEFNLDCELIANIAYYVYLILGIDFDSFAPHGGEPYFRKAESIVSQMQGSESKGWSAFADKLNRHAVITALMSDSQSAFRDLWYAYHRSGLDQMALSAEKGRSQITEACSLLHKIRNVDVQTPLLSLFINAKLDELINIYSKASRQEKVKAYNMLSEEYPTYSIQLEKIRQE